MFAHPVFRSLSYATFLVIVVALSLGSPTQARANDLAVLDIRTYTKPTPNAPPNYIDVGIPYGQVNLRNVGPTVSTLGRRVQLYAYYPAHNNQLPGWKLVFDEPLPYITPGQTYHPHARMPAGPLPRPIRFYARITPGDPNASNDVRMEDIP